MAWLGAIRPTTANDAFDPALWETFVSTTLGVGHPARRRAEGGQDGGWRLRVAAVAYCEAADRVVNSASPRAAAPRSLDAVLCPDTLQPPHAPDGRGTATGRRRTRPAGGLPPTVDAWQPSCGDRVCGHLHHVRDVRLQLGGSLGPRAWGARQGREVTCARGGVALRAACGCGGDLRRPSSGGLLRERSLRRSFTA
jgi:hypothetical protein